MIIGRESEIKLLQDVVKDNKPHFIAVYGRRRVGKTYLIRESFANRFSFQHTGLAKGTISEQLYAFTSSLKDVGYNFKKKPKTWLEAFDGLKEYIINSAEKKKIIFIDELSWMDTHKSGFITALENFYNSFVSTRKDIVLIVCASATSWMLSNIIHNKGGLYNRLTEQIHLRPFTLKECLLYVKDMNLALTHHQILQYYMIFGGVPYYWTFLKKGLSLSANIDYVLFSRDAPLKKEFKYLFSSIFRKPEQYELIIQCLAEKKIGLTREEIIKYAKIANSGDLTKKLIELESCGFIRCYYPIDKSKKNAIYQLVDFFTLFYYTFLKEMPTDEHFWTNQINTPLLNTWYGLAFERVCFDHINQIKSELGISGVLTEIKSFNCKRDLDKGLFGSQIDLLIIRRDQVINLCEIKYSNAEYIITQKDEKSMNNKIHDLIAVTKTKYAIYPTLITTYGLVENSYSSSIQSVITLEALFN